MTMMTMNKTNNIEARVAALEEKVNQLMESMTHLTTFGAGALRDMDVAFREWKRRNQEIRDKYK